MKKIAIISCIVAMQSSAMDNVKSTWLLSQDNVKKIMACSDVQSRKALRLTCHDMLKIKTEDLLLHSPLILNRHDHKLYMTHAAQTKNESIMQNLLNNAMRCDHEDALDMTSIFFSIIPMNDDMLGEMIISLLEKGRRDGVNEAINSKHVGNSTKIFIRNYRNQNFDKAHLFLSQIMALYRTDKAMMDRYICKEYEITNPDVIITDNLTPLQVAAREHNLALTELILLNSEDTINDADCDGRTPLYLTANEEIVRLLLACKNIQPNKKPKNNFTPLYKAVGTKRQLLIDLFLAQPNFI